MQNATISAQSLAIVFKKPLTLAKPRKAKPHKQYTFKRNEATTTKQFCSDKKKEKKVLFIRK